MYSIELLKLGSEQRLDWLGMKGLSSEMQLLTLEQVAEVLALHFPTLVVGTEMRVMKLVA